MNILDIKDPSFLKQLNEKELNEVCADIRNFLLESISKTGGHFSSNLGSIELTVALHYVFDAPHDRILFDVGHQCYPHKILTGRAKDFPNLRRYKGLSGFQKRKESIYDCFEAGHSSTSLSAALGMAVARDLNHEKYDIIPVIGDGSIGSGMALEALNEIGYEKRKLIIILNDNNMSISENVGALSQNFERLRHSKGYFHLKGDIKSYLSKKRFGKSIISGIHNLKETIKNTVVDAGIFKELNLDYHGPIDGHNLHDLIRVLEFAKESESPCVIHVITKKGKGYILAENDESGIWHGVSPFDLQTGKSSVSEAEGYASTSKIVADTIEDMMLRNEDIITITPAMRQGSALNSIFAHFPNRSFDTGIAEEHAMTFSAGLALNGKRPFLSIYSTFMQRAYDQLNHDVCRMDLPVVLGIDRAGLVGADGETHHGVFDISLFNAIPNIILAEGKDAKEMRSLLHLAFSQNHPFALRYPRVSLLQGKESEKEEIKVGQWEWIRRNDNDNCFILAYGPDILELKRLIDENNLPYSLVNCRFIKPMDVDMLHQIFQKKKDIFVYETDMQSGSLGESILAFASKNRYYIPVHLTSIEDGYVEQGGIAQLRKDLGIDVLQFLEKVGKITYDSTTSY